MSDNTPIFFRQMAVRKMVVDLAIEEKTIEKVLGFVFKEAKAAFHEHGSIEVSGFGKFVMRKHTNEKEKNRMRGLLEKWKQEMKEDDDEGVVRKRLMWIENMNKDLATIERLENDI